MPRKEKTGILNAGSILGIFFALLGIYSIFSMFFDICPLFGSSRGFKEFFCLGQIGLILFFGSFAILFLIENPKCYYCQKKILALQKGLILSWPEETKHSHKEFWIKEGFHQSCHENAAIKFKIPRPKFAEFKI